MPKSKQRIKRRLPKNKDTKQSIFLGTSLVAQGELRLERIFLNNKSIDAYVAKMKATRDPKERASIRREPVGLRVLFIPFKGNHNLHLEQVSNEEKKIQEEWNKKWNGEQRYRIVKPLRKYQRTSNSNS